MEVTYKINLSKVEIQKLRDYMETKRKNNCVCGLLDCPFADCVECPLNEVTNEIEVLESKIINKIQEIIKTYGGDN